MLYNVIFTAGGRLKGAKISEAEYAMFKLHAEAFKLKYPQARIHDKLGMATLEIDDISELEKDPTIYSISKMNNFQPQATIQQNAPWHLLDISHAQYSAYEYTTSGKGIDVYILDTGIDASHNGLKNVVKGMVKDIPTNDHGTHVAGCAQSVAKDCRLIDIQVFDPFYDPYLVGAMYFLDGLNWLLNVHEPGYVAIANMSLGGVDDGYSMEAEKSAIQALMAEGVICVVAAGNESVDASTFAPANTPGVICVGAYDSEHAQASFSNFGSTVNIWAPGVGITSTVFNNSYAAYDGTSMAAPIVAGVCARYLELCPYITQAEMLTRLTTYATAGRVSADMPGFSKNKKLGKRLEGMVNGQRYGVVHRYPTVFRQSSYGTMELATEVTKVTIPEVPNPTVPTPIVLPEPFGYDDGVVFINADMSIEFLNTTYQPTSIVDTTFNYNYPGTIILSITLNEDKSYTIQVTSQKVFTFTFRYYGFDARIKLDGTLVYKDITYVKNNLNYDYDYPAIRVSVSTDHNLTFGVPDTPPPAPIEIKPLITNAIFPNIIGLLPSVSPLPIYPSDKIYATYMLKTAVQSNIISIDVEDPANLMSYTLNLSFASGTFSYSGIGITKQKNKSVITVQGHNGTVERVKESIAFGQPPLTIEGRLLPSFTTEYVFLKKEKSKVGTPYQTATLINEIASQAGTTVTFKATDVKLKEYNYAGRFTSALENLAEESCGYLLQQNGTWTILPIGNTKGTYTVKESSLISVEFSNNSDCLETVLNYAKSLYDMILQRDEAQRALDGIQNQIDKNIENLPSDPVPTATSWSDEDWQPAGEVDFSFGFTGRYPLVKMNDNIYADASIWTSTAWEEWDAKATKDTNYFWKVEEYNYKDTYGKLQYKMRGLKSLNMVHLYYPISASEDGVLYRAIGDVKNMSLAIAYAGDKDTYWSVDPVKKTRTVSVKSGDTIQSVTTTSFYLDFTCNAPGVFAATTSREDKNFYYAKLKLEYLPAASKPWKFSVNILKDYTLLASKGYLIPDAGGAVLNKNGNEVAQYDRIAMTIKLQNGAIVSTVTRATDTTDSEGNVVYGKPTILTPPQSLEAGIEAISGSITPTNWPMRTQGGQLFGYISNTTGYVYYANDNQIGNCTLPFKNNLMLITKRDQTTQTDVTVGIIQNGASSSATASFGNSIDYPIVTADANYAKLQQALLNYQKTELETDVDYAKAKIACLKSRLGLYGVSNFTELEAATSAWKAYYDAEYKVDNPKILSDGSKETPPTQQELDKLKNTAETADSTAFSLVNSCKTYEQIVTVTELYTNVLPLAGQILDISIKEPPIKTTNNTIIESVAFNGLTTTITAKAIII